MLQINLVIEDAKISLSELEEEIQEDEDHVQSTDIAGKSAGKSVCERWLMAPLAMQKL